MTLAEPHSAVVHGDPILATRRTLVPGLAGEGRVREVSEVPEPSTVALSARSPLALAAVARRRKR